MIINYEKLTALKMRVHTDCRILCKQSVTSADVDLFQKRINLEYSIHLLADNLPAATKLEYTDSGNWTKRILPYTRVRD